MLGRGPIALRRPRSFLLALALRQQGHYLLPQALSPSPPQGHKRWVLFEPSVAAQLLKSDGCAATCLINPAGRLFGPALKR